MKSLTPARPDEVEFARLTAQQKRTVEEIPTFRASERLDRDEVYDRPHAQPHTAKEPHA